jgi:hypothetical protein
MQRAEHELSRLRRGQRGLYRFEIPHFAEQDHVRRLPKRRAEGRL